MTKFPVITSLPETETPHENFDGEDDQGGDDEEEESTSEKETNESESYKDLLVRAGFRSLDKLPQADLDSVPTDAQVFQKGLAQRILPGAMTFLAPGEHDFGLEVGKHMVPTLIDSVDPVPGPGELTPIFIKNRRGWLYAGMYRYVEKYVIPPRHWKTLDWRLDHIKRLRRVGSRRLFKVFQERGIAKTKEEAASMTDADIVSLFESVSFSLHWNPCWNVGLTLTVG